MHRTAAGSTRAPGECGQEILRCQRDQSPLPSGHAPRSHLSQVRGEAWKQGDVIDNVPQFTTGVEAGGLGVRVRVRIRGAVMKVVAEEVE